MLNNSLRCTSLLLKGERHFSQGAELSHLSLIWDFSVYTGQTRNLKITNSTVLFGNKTCEINLTCSVENPNDSVSFTWQPLGRMGPDLTISWDPEISNEQNYSCIAKNPVNNLSSTLKKKKKFFFFKSAKSLCKGNSLHQASLRALTRYLLFLCSASPVSCTPHRAIGGNSCAGDYVMETSSQNFKIKSRCSLQHYLPKPKGGNSPSVHRQMKRAQS
nr:SLAM family member 6 [Loxodonta africana]